MRNVIWYQTQTRLINEDKHAPLRRLHSLRNLIHAYSIKQIFILLQTLFGTADSRSGLRNSRSPYHTRAALMC